MTVKYTSRFKIINTKEVGVSVADGVFDGALTPRMGLSSKLNTIVFFRQADSKSFAVLTYENLTWYSNSSSTSFIYSINFFIIALKLFWSTCIPKPNFFKTNSSSQSATQQKMALLSFLRL